MNCSKCGYETTWLTRDKQLCSWCSKEMGRGMKPPTRKSYGITIGEAARRSKRPPGYHEPSMPKFKCLEGHE